MSDPTPHARRSPLEHERDAPHASAEAVLAGLIAIIDCNAWHLLRLPATGETIQMGEMMDAVDVLAAERDALRAEVERLRSVLRTIVFRAQDAKQRCTDGEPVSAYNVASGILGQIGSDVAALTSTETPHE